MNPFLPRRPFLVINRVGDLTPRLVLGYVAEGERGREMRLFARAEALLAPALLQKARSVYSKDSLAIWEGEAWQALKRIVRGDIPERMKKGRKNKRRRRGGLNKRLLAEVMGRSHDTVNTLFSERRELEREMLNYLEREGGA